MRLTAARPPRLTAAARGAAFAAAFAAALAAALAGGAPAAAQGPPPARDPAQQQLEASCRPDSVLATPPEAVPDSLGRRHPRVAVDSVAPALAAGDLGRAMAVAVGFARAALASAALPERERLALERRLALLDSTVRVAAALAGREQARFVAGVVRPAQWQLQPDDRGDFVLFPGEADSVRVTRADPVARQRALCWPAVAVEPVLAVLGAPARARTVEALDALAGRWDAYVRNGVSQLPWELAVNGLLRGRRGYEPPRQQLILLHPSVGVEATGNAWKGLRRADVALVEPVGWIFRYNADYTRALGVSGVLSFAADRNVAAGAVVHLWYPQARLGYVRRADPDPGRRGGVLVSVDLYGLLAGAPAELRGARAGALGRRLLAELERRAGVP